ncbi:MAG: hypothetical protein IJG87_10315 [Ruminococcus sp.]|nr:hypothetical protein [Ruminococcus sp.]
MGLFSFHKKPAVDGTVVMFAGVFATLNESYTLRVQRDMKTEGEELIRRHFVQLAGDHFREECLPPKQFNNYYTVIPFPRFPEEMLPQVKFWDDRTKEIVNRSSFNQMCRDMRDLWKTRLADDFPKYDRNAMEDGFENVNYDYYPDEGVIMLSMYLTPPLPV